MIDLASSYSDADRERRRTRSSRNAVRVERRSDTPFVLKLIALTNFLPEQLSFDILGFRLTATRLIFILVVPLLLVRLYQSAARRRYRFVLSDLLALLAGIWMILSLTETNGLQLALSHGGPIALEFCIGYMTTRILLSEHGQALSFAKLLCGVIVIVALLGLFDPLTGRFFVRNLASALTGYPVFMKENLYRNGLLRATGPLEHSILFGIACAIGLLLAISVLVRLRSLAICAYTLGAISSMSSASIQGIILGVALLSYNRMLMGVRRRWLGLIGVALTAIVMVFVFVPSPLGFIFRHLIADPVSGYYRLYTWQMAGEALANSPWFGLGFVTPESYDIPDSVDSVWLWSALTFGIPGSLLIGLSIVGAASLPTGGPRVSLTRAESKLGTMLGILIFLIVFWGFTVDFWGTDWVLVALLAGVRAHLGALGRINDP